jgi:signal peptidase II
MSNVTKKFVLSILPLMGVLFLDWWSKEWARGLDFPVLVGPLKFKLVLNYGVILGHLSELSLTAKESLLFTVGAFIFSVFILSLWLIPIRSRATIFGMSFLVGGILGNLIDRMTTQAVVDFISLSFIEGLPYMNLADIFQIMGYCCIACGVYRDSLYYWPKNDWRIKYLVNRNFQIRTSLLFSSLTFFASFIVIVFSYFFLKSQHSEFTVKTYFFSGLALSLFLSGISFLVGVLLTHRVAGPVYAIQRNLKNMLKGNIQKLELRNNDEFKELERTINLIQEEYHLLQETLTEDKKPVKKSDSEAA